MGYGEFDPDIDRTLRVGGRRFVERGGRGEFLRPTYGFDGGGGDDKPPVPRSLALKLVLMAVVMLALLVAIIVIFT